MGNIIITLDLNGKDILKLGSGSGNRTILISQQKPKKLTLTEINQDILNNTRHNLIKNNINLQVEYLVADWTQIKTRPFDILITNPPFVKSGKRYYRYFIDTLIYDAHKLIKKGGKLFFIQSSMAYKKKHKPNARLRHGGKDY